jgi:DUF1680 family protein
LALEFLERRDDKTFMNEQHKRSRDRHSRTRRHVVQALGLGALLPPLLPSFAAEPATRADGRDAPGQARLAPFPLTDVRLLASPFLDAQLRDERYLLQLEPDRMLHNFRVNAGLTPKAQVYGGWESQEPWIEIRCHGHTLGHYLSACAMMFATTGKAAFQQRVDYIVGELRACQDAAKSGLICAFPDGARQLENSVQGREFQGVPWYTMHKIFAGLRDAYWHASSAEAREVLERLAAYTYDLVAPLPDARMQKMLDREHGGMSEVLADVHAITGDPRYLDLAVKFMHRALLEPLSERRDVLDGLHSNTQIPKVIGAQRLYELTGRADYRAAAEFFWRTVIERRTYATGGNGDVEHFFPPREFAQRLQSAKTMETCCMHNMLRLTRALFQAMPEVAYADYYERTLYNGILASQDPVSGMMTYFQPTRPGYVKLFHTPTDSFWCCTGSGMENHAKYADSIYFRAPEALYVNLFIPSTLEWRERGLRLTQISEFPRTSSTQLTLHLERPTTLALRVRQPGWCPASTVAINGAPVRTYRTPGRYIELQREWRDGDRIDISMPMRLRLEPLPSAAEFVAVLYGPIVLAGRLGTEGLTPGADIIVNERTSGDMLNLPREVPSWALDPSQLGTRLRAVPNRPLTFRASGVRELPDLELIPYYAIAHERYNLYWHLVDSSHA